MSLLDALVPLGLALRDHHRGDPDGTITLRFDDGEAEEVKAGWFFRREEDFDALDLAALEVARGRVLDVGAGAGPHALALQRRGHEVTALEILPEAVEILRERGARDVRKESVLEHRAARPYDTVLLLMNGTGLAGTLAGLSPLLRSVRDLLAPGGRVVIDSTDPGDDDPGDGRHPGELQIQLEYRGVKGDPFPHLYAGPRTLADAAREAGLGAEVVVELPDGRFLAVCERLA